MRMGLVSLFNVQKDMTVAGEAEDGEQAIRMTRELKPDIARQRQEASDGNLRETRCRNPR